MFTKKVKYALRILIALAAEREGKGRPLRTDDLAERSGAPRNSIDHLILDIRDAGIISSIRGRSGGYMLARDPADIFISEVLRLFGEPIVPLPCLTLRSNARCNDCSDEQTCRIRKGLMTALEGYVRQVESLALSDLIELGQKD